MISPTEVCGLISETETAVCLLWCSVRRNDFVWQTSHSRYPVFLHDDENTAGLTNFMLMFIFVFYVWWLSSVPRIFLDCVWNVMAHTQKPHFRLSTKRTIPFKSTGVSVRSTTGSRGVRIGGSNAGYTVFRGSVKGTSYPVHSPVFPSLPLPSVTVCHHISTRLYLKTYELL